MRRRRWTREKKIKLGILITLLVVLVGVSAAVVWNGLAPKQPDSVQTGGGESRPAEPEAPSEGQSPQTPAEPEQPEKESSLPVPLSGKYPEMVVEPQEYQPLAEGDKVVYLTFDDGPCKTTPELLDVLDELGVKATFFVTAQFGEGETLEGYLKEISARGHEVAVHSYSHNYKEIYASVDAFLDDYKKMDDLILKATGKRSSVFRFPGGSNAGYNKAIRGALLEEMNSRGLVYHDWNAFNGDVEGANKTEMIHKAVKECSYTDKSVLLMHNIPGKDAVIESLPEIVKQLNAKGYRFATLDGTVKPFQFAKVEG